jgi:hypothetical protein
MGFFYFNQWISIIFVLLLNISHHKSLILYTYIFDWVRLSSNWYRVFLTSLSMCPCLFTSRQRKRTSFQNVITLRILGNGWTPQIQNSKCNTPLPEHFRTGATADQLSHLFHCLSCWHKYKQQNTKQYNLLIWELHQFIQIILIIQNIIKSRIYIVK